MKKLFVFLMVLVLMADNFSPVMAKKAKNPFRVKIDSPESTVFGGRPIQIVVTVKNISGKTANFDYSISQFFQGGTNNSSRLEISNGEIYQQKGDRSRISAWWRGELKSGEKAIFTIHTYSGERIGGYDLYEVFDLLSDSVYERGSISLVAETFDPRIEYATTFIQKYDEGKWMVGINFEVFTPTMTTYKLHLIPDDNCQMETLLRFENMNTFISDGPAWLGNYHGTYGSIENYYVSLNPTRVGKNGAKCSFMIKVESGVGEILTKEVNLKLK